MTMPRSPIFVAYRPAHNRLPGLGAGIWVPLHSSLATGIPDGPSPVALGSGHPATPFDATPGMYTFAANNTTAGIGIPHDEEDSLDAVLSLSAMTADTTIVTAMTCSYIEHADATGALWFYGSGTNAGNIGVNVTTTEAPMLTLRGVGASAGTSTNLTAASGKTFADFKAQGRFAVVTEIRATDTTTLSVRLLIGKSGTDWTGVYTASGINTLGNGATLPPGRNGSENHYGLVLGCRSDTISTINQTWGRGSTNTGAVGNFSARRFDTYNAAIAEAVLAELILHPLEFPAPFLS